MPHVLVTGGAGFIGSHLVAALLDRGDSVCVLDNLSTGLPGNLPNHSSVTFIEGDVRDSGTAMKAAESAEVVFHLAALASVPLSIDKPLDTHDHCSTGTLTMLAASQAHGVRRFVYSSSSSIYGNRDDQQQTEEDLPAPESPYAAAKLSGEYYCRCFQQSMGLETVCLRYFNVFGPRQSLSGPYAAVIPAFIHAALNNQPATIYGDGSQTRDFTYVQSVVAANLLAAEVPAAAGRTYNIAHGLSTSIGELHQHIQQLTGSNVPATHEPPRTGDVLHSRANIQRASNEMGYRPGTELPVGLQETIDYYRDKSAADGN